MKKKLFLWKMTYFFSNLIIQIVSGTFFFFSNFSIIPPSDTKKKNIIIYSTLFMHSLNWKNTFNDDTFPLNFITKLILKFVECNDFFFFFLVWGGKIFVNIISLKTKTNRDTKDNKSTKISSKILSETKYLCFFYLNVYL